MVRQLNKLSSRFVETTKDAGRHADGGGLYLQVTQGKNGVTKSWLFRYMRGTSTSREMGLGPVSLNKRDGLVTLSMARDKAFAARKALSTGIDPLSQREQERAAGQLERAKTLTFKECAERYIAAHKSSWKSSKHAGQWKATLETYAYPKIGHLSASAIDAGLILQILEQKAGDGPEDTLWNRKTETASRVRGRIETVLSWAKARGYRHGENPATWRGHLEHSLPKRAQVAPVEHHPALPYVELPTFMAKLRAKEGISARALEFTILTVARTGDTIGATWPEIDMAGKLWTVPAARVKGKKGARKRDHVVPLSNEALNLLAGLPTDGGFVFAGGKEGVGLSNAAMSELLKGMGYEPNVATVHGFRSTFKDWCSEQTAYPNELSEIAMAHTVSDKVEAAYRRGDMRQKRARLMSEWAKYCGRRPSTSSNVMPLTAGIDG